MVARSASEELVQGMACCVEVGRYCDRHTLYDGKLGAISPLPLLCLNIP